MKKFIALFLVFSILAISSNLYTKEKRGAELVITKKDSQKVKGELIAVKENSLLLLDSKSGADVSIDIADIRIIRIVNKSKAVRGILIGGGAGALWGYLAWKEGGYEPTLLGIIGAMGAAIGLLLEIIHKEKDRLFQIKGKSRLEIIVILQELRSKARVTNFQ